MIKLLFATPEESTCVKQGRGHLKIKGMAAVEKLLQQITQVSLTTPAPRGDKS